jgi:hypothetical protein
MQLEIAAAKLKAHTSERDATYVRIKLFIEVPASCNAVLTNNLALEGELRLDQIKDGTDQQFRI